MERTWDIDLVLFVSGVAESSDGRLTLPTCMNDKIGTRVN